MTKMTLKQQRFADEYIITGNATQSAIKAGYSKKTARAIANENLMKPYIKEYIDERLAKLESEKIATQEEVLQYLTSVMRGEKTEPLLVLDGEGTQKVIEAVPSVQSRTKAAELLGKRYGTFTDRVDINAQIESKPKFDDIVNQLGGSGLDE
ncbi:terminase small subunit [uncultured Granulicatella sp.]|uniref:terminase small subunit n=1 Tax=uncultured Granulicatella sp. TaxID=316089 RepID=UPI0028D721E6|nr:terminase small subunit [uncultured Granulicatella sp.]